MTTLVAQQSVIAETEARKLGDASFGGQVDRWGSKPLKTDDENLTTFGSFKGRGACLINFVATPFREVYREGKNVFVLAEKVFNFVRVFFQCIFREEGMSWSDCRDRLKDVVSSFAALFGRVLTVLLDELKLGAGILYPKLAIDYNSKNEDKVKEVNLDEDGDSDDIDESTPSSDEDDKGHTLVKEGGDDAIDGFSELDY